MPRKKKSTWIPKGRAFRGRQYLKEEIRRALLEGNHTSIASIARSAKTSPYLAQKILWELRREDPEVEKAISRLSFMQRRREMETMEKALNILRSYRWPLSLAEFASKIGTSPKGAIALLRKISAYGAEDERRLAKSFLRNLAESSSRETLSGARDNIVGELDRVYSKASEQFKRLGNRELMKEYKRLKQAVEQAKSEEERRALIMQRNAAKIILELRDVEVD